MSLKKAGAILLLVGFMAVWLGIGTAIIIKSINGTKSANQIEKPTVTTSPKIPNNKFTCPQSEYVDCMPGPDARYRPECEKPYLEWATKNCPGFKGAAL